MGGDRNVTVSSLSGPLCEGLRSTQGVCRAQGTQGDWCRVQYVREARRPACVLPVMRSRQPPHCAARARGSRCAGVGQESQANPPPRPPPPPPPPGQVEKTTRRGEMFKTSIRRQATPFTLCIEHCTQPAEPMPMCVALCFVCGFTGVWIVHLWGRCGVQRRGHTARPVLETALE